MKKTDFYSVAAIAVSALALLLTARLLILMERAAPTSVMSAASKRTVIIDAGHGGFDPGATASDGTLEKDVNLAISLKLADVFCAFGHRVIMTRVSDVGTDDEGLTSIASRKKSDIHNRVDLANGTDGCVYLSIHQNAFGDHSQDGTQLLYGVKNENGKALADAIFASVKANLQPDNRREVKRGTDSIYILQHIQAPTALIECGFISNDTERKLLIDEDYQKRIAFSIYLGYCDFIKQTDGYEDVG